MTGVMVCVQLRAGPGEWRVAGDSPCRKDTFYAFTGCLHNIERAGALTHGAEGQKPVFLCLFVTSVLVS